MTILERKLGIDKNDRAAAAFENAISNGIAPGAKTAATRIAAGVPVNDPSAASRPRLPTGGDEDPGRDEAAGHCALDASERVEARVAKVLAPTPKGADPVKVTEALNAAQLESNR